MKFKINTKDLNKCLSIFPTNTKGFDPLAGKIILIPTANRIIYFDGNDVWGANVIQDCIGNDNESQIAIAVSAKEFRGVIITYRSTPHLLFEPQKESLRIQEVSVGNIPKLNSKGVSVNAQILTDFIDIIAEVEQNLKSRVRITFKDDEILKYKTVADYGFLYYNHNKNSNSCYLIDPSSDTQVIMSVKLEQLTALLDTFEVSTVFLQHLFNVFSKDGEVFVYDIIHDDEHVVFRIKDSYFEGEITVLVRRLENPNRKIDFPSLITSVESMLENKKIWFSLEPLAPVLQRWLHLHRHNKLQSVGFELKPNGFKIFSNSKGWSDFVEVDASILLNYHNLSYVTFYIDMNHLSLYKPDVHSLIGLDVEGQEVQNIIFHGKSTIIFTPSTERS